MKHLDAMDLGEEVLADLYVGWTPAAKRDFKCAKNYWHNQI